MKLTEAEKGSDAWTRIRQHLQERLTKYREQNDNATLGEVETSRLRGRIAEVKVVLDMEKEPQRFDS